MNNNVDFQLILAGECIPQLQMKGHNEPEYIELRDIIKGADAAYCHIETTFAEHSDVYAAKGNFLGELYISDPEECKELKWLGFSLASLAGNHSYDFADNGIDSTMKAVKAAGIKAAGTGHNLEEAREAVFLETEKRRRVALISVASGNISTEWANLSKNNMPSRPGPNPLRAKVTYSVPAEEAELLKEAGSSLHVLRKHNPNIPTDIEEDEFRIVWPAEQGTIAASGTVAVFRESDRYDVESFCHKGDLEGNLKSIQEAGKLSDLIIVAHHCCTKETVRNDEAPMFVKEFAHAAIDAGADVFAGHGWNRTLGIEMYKGKPIFYGLGNFIAQSRFQKYEPFDNFDGWNVAAGDYSKNMAMFDRKAMEGDLWWESVVADVRFDEKRELTSVKLIPIELGNERKISNHKEGRPIPAKGEKARKILERVCELSGKLGTHFEIVDDYAIWQS